MGRWRTQSLFHEYSFKSEENGLEPIFTLKEQDITRNGEVLPSLHRLFVNLGDITGYLLATQHLGGWEHWLAICKSSWFQEYLAAMTEELEVKLRAEALVGIIQESTSGSKSSYQAKKYLSDAGWKDKKKGRPSSAEIQAERERKQDIADRISSDAERVGLRLVNEKEEAEG